MSFNRPNGRDWGRGLTCIVGAFGDTPLLPHRYRHACGLQLDGAQGVAVVKYNVFQPPPKALFVVAGAPWTMVPRWLAFRGALIATEAGVQLLYPLAV